MSLVVLALVGLFGVMPYTYRMLQTDSLRAEASTAAQRYLDDVRLAVQAGNPAPAPTTAPLDMGYSFVTGQANTSTAAVDLSANCTQPDGLTSSLFDCTVTVVLNDGESVRTLAPLETYISRQLP